MTLLSSDVLASDWPHDLLPAPGETLLAQPDQPPGPARRRPRKRPRPADPLGRRSPGRVDREQLLRLAEHLAPEPRALITAYFDLGMPLAELAALRGLTVRQARRRLDHLQDVLADPCFLLAARAAGHLPPDLAALARGYWLAGDSLRALAAARRQSLYAVRRNIADIRAWMLLTHTHNAPHPRPSDGENA
jgi:hypothetical protein